MGPCASAQGASANAVAILFPASYREAQDALRQHERLVRDFIADNISTSVLVATKEPVNQQQLRASFGDNLVLSVATDEEEEGMYREIERLTGFPANDKGFLVQWYRFGQALRLMVRFEETVLKQKFGVVLKMRFELGLSLRVPARQLYTQVLREQDAVWHAGRDYFFMGSRQVMEVMLNGLNSSGACHNTTAAGT